MGDALLHLVAMLCDMVDYNDTVTEHLWQQLVSFRTQNRCNHQGC